MQTDFEAFRREMPVADRWAYFDHAAVAPLSAPARDAVAGWLRQAAEEGDTVWPSWAKRVEEVRGVAAAAVGAATEEIAFVPNTTSGITLVAEGLRWREGDNVVTVANEFPSNVYPWMNLARRGVETRLAPVEPDGGVDVQKLEACCDARTRLVSVSWVGYASGWRLNLDDVVDLARRRGALLMVDAIQGLGVFPMDVARTRIDFFAADGHKWLLGPEGAGLLFVRREHLERLDPMVVGWNSVQQGQAFDRLEFRLRDEAARYEGGTQNMVGVLGLGASLELLARFGWGPQDSAIAERIRSVTDKACARLHDLGAVIHSHRDEERWSGIVSFSIPGADPQQVRRRCLEKGVALSCRSGRLRISPHAYNNDDDLERLAESLHQPS